MLRIMAFIALTVSAYVSLTGFALMARVVMGVFSEGTGVFASFIYTVTEPVLSPIRRKLDSMEMFQDMPIDMSVFVAIIIVMVLSLLFTIIGW